MFQFVSYYSAIYGLQLHLNQGVPGLLLSTQQSQPVDVQVHFRQHAFAGKAENVVVPQS